MKKLPKVSHNVPKYNHNPASRIEMPGQSVKKAANRQNTKVRYYMGNVKKQRHCEPVRTLVWQSAFLKTPCHARCFDLLHNSHSTVSTYADERELLVLTALVTSARLSKTEFFDSLTRHLRLRCRVCFHYFANSSAKATICALEVSFRAERMVTLFSA